MRKLPIPAIFTMLAMAGCVAAVAQEMDVQALNAMHWRLIGSFRGGRVSAVAGSPDHPNTYFFGTPGGGIWKSTNAGHVWQPIFDKERVASIGALAVAQSDSRILYAGTGEQTPGDGIYKSEDEGQTWTHSGLEETRFIQSVIVDPHNPDIVIAAANSIGVFVFSRPYPSNSLSVKRGVFLSLDGGKSWKQTLNRDDSAGVFDLAVDPDDPKILYASLFVPAPAPTGAEPPDSDLADNSVIYKSTDEGATWSLLQATGLPEKNRGRLGISVAAGLHGQRLYAVMEQGFYRSDDAGATWTQSTKDPRIVGNSYFSRIFTDTRNPDTLYVAQTSLYRSTDGGHTFEAYVGAPSGDDFHVLWIDPNHPNRLLLGVDQGAIISVDAGKSWSSWYNQPTGQFYHVSTDHQFPYRTYAAQQDSGTQSVPSRSDNGEITPSDVTSIGGFEFCFIAPDPLHPDWIYSGGWYGTVVRYDRKTGQTATVFEKGSANRVTQMPPIFFSVHDPHKLYYGSQYVLKTSDDGKTWQAVSPDLTEWNGIDESKKNPDKPRPPAIEALAESPKNNAEMWAATTNRLVQLTRDGGKHWQKVTPPGLADPLQILYIEPSHHSDGEAFLTVGSGRQSVPPQILRTRDYGATWQSIIQGLPVSEGVRVVREDPKRKGLLFAGTDSTVYLSFDDGDHWHALTLNLPATPVTDMEVHGDDLVISTYGRGLWILDDVAPIRQLSAEFMASPAHLLKPVEALRVRWDTFQDTPLPIETPTAQNPPDGVLIDYYLKTGDGQPTLTIRDAKGTVIRTFTTQSTEPNLPLPNVPEYWFAKPTIMEASAGLHRIVWDLRYEAPKALPASYFGPILEYTEYTLADHAIPYETPRQQPQGPLVTPGEYTVELKAGGQTYRQPITVRLDPRVSATASDLALQLTVAQQLTRGMQVSYDEFQRLKSLKTALTEHEVKSSTKEEDLEKQIKAVSDGSKEAPGFGPINRDLSRLLSSVESADQRPTEPILQAIKQECDDLDKALTRWKALNAELASKNPFALPVAGGFAANGCAP